MDSPATSTFTSYFHSSKKPWNFGRWQQVYLSDPNFPQEKQGRFDLWRDLLVKYSSSEDDELRAKARSTLAKMKKPGSNVTINKVVMNDVGTHHGQGDINIMVGSSTGAGLATATASTTTTTSVQTSMNPIASSKNRKRRTSLSESEETPLPTKYSRSMEETTSRDRYSNSFGEILSSRFPRHHQCHCGNTCTPTPEKSFASFEANHNLFSLRESLYSMHSQLCDLSNQVTHLRGEVERFREGIAVIIQHPALRALDTVRDPTPVQTDPLPGSGPDSELELTSPPSTPQATALPPSLPPSPRQSQPQSPREYDDHDEQDDQDEHDEQDEQDEQDEHDELPSDAQEE